MISEPVVLVRRNTMTARLYGVVFTAIPAGAGAWLVVQGGIVRILLGIALFLIAFVALRANLRFARRVEILGARAVVRALWIGGRELDLDKLAELRVRPIARPSPDGGAPLLEPSTYDLMFADGKHLFLGGGDFAGAEWMVERAMAASAEGFGFPVRLGAACLVHWVQNLKDPRLGCAAAYALEGGMLSLFVYRGDEASVPEGIEADVIGAELEKACNDIRTMAERNNAGQVREVRRGIAGAGGASAMRMVVFEIGESTSMVYMAGRGGRFLKARFTGPASAEGRVEEALAALARPAPVAESA